MSNPGHTTPGGLRPGYTELPDGRGRMVTMKKLSHGSQLRADLVLAWGGLYSAVEKVDCTGASMAHLAGLRLVGGQEAQQTQGGGEWVWVRIYEELPASAEVQVGKVEPRRMEDGRWEVVQDSIQLSTATFVSQKPGTTALTIWPVANTGLTGTASTDVLALAVNPFQDGDPVRFSSLTGGSGLSTSTTYYVRDRTDNTFKVSTTVGGTAVNFTTNVTAGTITLYVTAVLADEAAPDSGVVRRIRRRYITQGLISTSSIARRGGLVEVTWVSVLTKQTPTGVVTADRTTNVGGAAVYTVSAVQTAAGASPAGSSYSYTTKRRWQAPGLMRAEVLTKTVLTPGSIPSSYEYKTLTVNRAAPVIFESLEVTVTITWQSSSAVGSVSPAMWDPQKWCLEDVDIIMRGPRPVRRVQDRPGYCVVPASAGDGYSLASVTTTTDAVNYYIFGEGELLFQGGNTHTVKITGPEYPAGESRTIEPVSLDPDFTDVSGAQWYRKTQVTATLPALPALPTLTT